MGMNVVDVFNALARHRGIDAQDASWRADMSRRGMEANDDGILQRKRKPLKNPEKILDQEYARESDLRRGRKIKSLKKSFTEAVTPKKVVEIFDALARMHSLRHDFISGGCEARAHLMCAEMFDLGVIPQKSWAVGKLSPGVRNVNWQFHVAPVLNVKMPDGSQAQIVIDPAVFDGPVTVAEWRRQIKASDKNSAVTAYDERPCLKIKGSMGDYADRGEMVTVHSDRRAAAMLENAEDWSVCIKKRAISGFRQQFCA